MEDDGIIHIPIANDLYRQIDVWRIELCLVYGLVEMDMDTFIHFLLTRAHIDITILLTEPTEGLYALRDFRKLNDN